MIESDAMSNEKETTVFDRGLGAAEVAVATAPIKGILLLPLSTLKVSFPHLRTPSMEAA